MKGILHGKKNHYVVISILNKDADNIYIVTHDSQKYLAKTSYHGDHFLIKEIKMLKYLSQENVKGIPKFIDEAMYSNGNRLCTALIMEYIESPDIFYTISGEQKISNSIIKDWIIQICDILLHVHSLEIIHRDIKPENMIWHNGAIYIIDWEFSEFVMDVKDMAGSEYYVAPETRFKQPGFFNDVWSLAVSFHVLLTGVHINGPTNIFRDGVKGKAYSLLPKQSRNFLVNLFDEVFVPYEKRISLKNFAMRIKEWEV